MFSISSLKYIRIVENTETASKAPITKFKFQRNWILNFNHWYIAETFFISVSRPISLDSWSKLISNSKWLKTLLGFYCFVRNFATTCAPIFVWIRKKTRFLDDSQGYMEKHIRRFKTDICCIFRNKLDRKVVISSTLVRSRTELLTFRLQQKRWALAQHPWLIWVLTSNLLGEPPVFLMLQIYCSCELANLNNVWNMTFLCWRKPT